MFVILRKSIWSFSVVTIILTVFLVGCAGNTMSTETSGLNTPIATEISVTQSPSETRPLATSTASHTPEPPTINYFDLSPAERLESSQTLVEQANNFSGEVEIPVELNGQTYNFFWNPTAFDKYDTGLTGAWKPEGSSDNLDRTGETLPPIVIAGYENEDGSLVVVDPVTGQETYYANQNIPSLGGIISYRDLYNLPQDQLATVVTEDTLKDTEFSSNTVVADNIKALRDQAFYIPVIIYGNQTSVFATGFDNGGGKGQDVPEARYSAIETPTNNALAPIYSPETGDFMFFINIMSGNPLSVYTAFYSPDGSIDSRSVISTNNLAFGKDNQDQFGIIAESSSRISHYLGGGSVFIENGSGVGNVDIIRQIMNASSEEEIMNILDSYRLLISYPSLIYRPER